MNEFLRNIHRMLDARYGVKPSEQTEEFSNELTLKINLDALTEDELDELAELGVITWVSAEGTESDLEDEIDFEEGNISADLSTMVTSEPRGADGYSISSISEKGKRAGFMLGEAVTYSMYKVGETVITQNPYTHEFVHEDYDGTPLYFHITSIAWDGDDETFRYQLGEEDEWISEEWLDKPMVTMMTKVFVPFASADGDRFVEKETGLRVLVNEFTTELTVNTYLDMMLSDDANVRSYGKEMLAKLSTTEEAQ